MPEAYQPEVQNLDAQVIWLPGHIPKLGPESVQRAERVLGNLENLQPPCDWLPRSAVDPLIEKAFAIGWPPNEPNAQLPRAGEYHD